MGEVRILPGVERHDIGPDIPSRTVLECAIDAGVTSALVIGYDHRGFYFSSSSPDMDRNLGMLQRAMHEILHTDTHDEAFEVAPPPESA